VSVKLPRRASGFGLAAIVTALAVLRAQVNVRSFKVVAQ